MDPFSEGYLSQVLEGHLKGIVQEIASLDSDYVLKASPTELEQHFIDKAQVQPLVLHVDKKSIASRSGIDVDVSYDFSRAIRPGQRATVRGTRLVIEIPYEGDKSLWKFRPSSFTLSGYPEVSISESTISFSVEFPDDSAKGAEIKDRIESDVRRLGQTVGSSYGDVVTFNNGLGDRIRAAIQARRQRATETSRALAELGIPLKHIEAPPAYIVPMVRKPSPVSLPTAPGQPYFPEPFLEAKEFEYIVTVLNSMGLVIERNPQSFVSLKEEDIRNHILLQLNGHYGGTATGETFNAAGKTDILIRVRDRNVFIAECKFWKGSREFDDAITQLLGYLSWRDSKCALIVFNRTQDSTGVSQKMKSTVMARREFKKALGPDRYGHERYILVKESDPGREIAVTTLLFDIPKSGSKDDSGDQAVQRC